MIGVDKVQPDGLLADAYLGQGRVATAGRSTKSSTPGPPVRAI